MVRFFRIKVGAIRILGCIGCIGITTIAGVNGQFINAQEAKESKSEIIQETNDSANKNNKEF